MNNRLELIMQLIPDGIGVVDVGTDHGYLPTMLVSNGYKGNIMGTDINEDPLSKARRNVEREGIGDRVQLLLCDGLELCAPDSIDTIVIAGMGGDTICGILDRAEWCMDEKFTLILQPMSKATVLRYWLSNNGFAIEGEQLVRDNGRIYQIVIARYSGVNQPLSEAELYCGRLDCIKGNALFPEYLEILIKRFEKMISGMSMVEGHEALPVNRRILEQFYAIKEAL